MSIITKDKVTSGNYHITRPEAYVNAYYLIGYMVAHGYATLEAASAIAGNAIHEINCNPGGAQGYSEPPDMTKGYGILQWTPATKIFNYAQANGLPVGDMDTQIEFIWYQANYEPQNGYIPKEPYLTPHNYLAFLRSTMDVDYLARAFCINAEKWDATEESLNGRASRAVYMYNMCLDDPPEWKPVGFRRAMPLYMKYIAITGGD